eukprot:12154-Heterococcus_DN1.PRE.2
MAAGGPLPSFAIKHSGPSAGVLVSDVPPTFLQLLSPLYLPQMKPTSIIACVAALSSCTQQASSFVCLPSTQARIANSRSCVRPCRSSADASDPKDMKVSEIKAELDQLRVDYHGLFEKLFMLINSVAVHILLLLPVQRELVARLQESRAASTEINELRTKFIADLQAADMPEELKKTFTEMAADPAMLREMAADVNLLQDVGENPDSFKDAMDQAGGLEGNKQKSVKEMKVSEIKGELDMRGISHSGLYEKRELVHRLEEARALGQADPSIVDKFNKKMLETRVDPEMKAAMDDMANDPDLLNKIKAS